MALIKCPECGKEISSKASACIHCGCPIENDANIKEDKYNVIVEALQEGLMKYNKIFKISQELDRITYFKVGYGKIEKCFHEYSEYYGDIIKEPPFTIFKGLSQQNAETIQSVMQKYGATVTLKIANDNDEDALGFNEALSKFNERANAPVKCPRCGSTSITTGERGFSIMTGFLGSNKTVNRCAKCGYTWKP